MIVSSIQVAIATVPLLSTMVSAQILQSYTFDGNMRSLDPKGCFSNVQPMELHSRWAHQSIGNCQGVCYGLRKAAMALQAGDCYCGDLLPAKAFQVDTSKCTTPCPGTADDKCGGIGLWWVLTSGYSLGQVGFLPPDQVTGSAASQFSTSTSSTVSDGSTVVETITQGPSEETNSSLPKPTDDGSSDDSGTNVAGIAAGVVVGIVGIAALIGGVYFFLRRRRRQAEEEEKRQQEIVSGFVDGGRKPGTSHSSMNDSRLDPELVRRQSDGSIADNQDYSRRILQVTNPDVY